jgi:membrane-associated protein
MDLIQRILGTIYDIPQLIALVGLTGITLIVYAETGLLFGVFLPGDSLLVTAGVFAARGDFNIVLLILLVIAAGVLGDATGYWVGWRAGKALYSRSDSRFFRQRHLQGTRQFYERHGGKTIVLARFIPIARTFAPVVAGVAGMKYSHFTAYNVIGGSLWATTMTLIGYGVGHVIPNLGRDIYLVVLGVLFISWLGPAISALRHRHRRRTIAAAQKAQLPQP